MDKYKDVVYAAVEWNNARISACKAPLSDKKVWSDLGAAESALSKALREFEENAKRMDRSTN